jgi:orotidine-5'-phosphate decarboxylase
VRRKSLGAGRVAEGARGRAPRLALALDVGGVEEALRLARRLRPYFEVAKVGLELFAAAGPQALAVAELGFEVFVDLKLHDIPTTVRRAARQLGRLGIGYATFHAAGGEAMLRAGVEGLAAGSAEAGLAAPVALAVTVLTSEPDAGAALLEARAAAAAAAGCGGVVCAAADLSVVRRAAPGLLRVVAGIRPPGVPGEDQARAATPAEAVAAGAELLVVGRAVTAAADPEAAAAAIAASLS